MQIQLKRHVSVGHRLLQCWVTFDVDEDDTIVQSICFNGRDVMRRVQEKELAQLCQSITHAEIQGEADRVKRDQQESRAGFGD